MCAYITATGSFLTNGGAPVSIAKAEHASAYWSVRPSTSRPRICSGDTKSTVPRNTPLPVIDVDCAALVSPKSVKYT